MSFREFLIKFVTFHLLWLPDVLLFSSNRTDTADNSQDQGKDANHRAFLKKMFLRKKTPLRCDKVVLNFKKEI